MPRKTYTIVKSEMSRIAYYKWQFLRRNKDYKNDYDGFSQKLIQFKKIKSLKDQKAEKITLVKKLQELEDKWCLTPLADYRKKRPNPLPEIGIDSGPVRELGLKDKCLSDFLYIMGKKEIISVPYVLNIAVSLSYPQNKIMPFIEKMLVERIKLRKKILKEIKQPGFSKYSQLPLYEEYLRVWDCVQAKRSKRQINSKKTWAIIANNLFPNKYNDNLEAKIQLVRDRYGEADRLIKGGYKEIK